MHENSASHVFPASKNMINSSFKISLVYTAYILNGEKSLAGNIIA